MGGVIDMNYDVPPCEEVPLFIGKKLTNWINSGKVFLKKLIGGSAKWLFFTHG